LLVASNEWYMSAEEEVSPGGCGLRH
jgi:hypothetical protein